MLIRCLRPPHVVGVVLAGVLVGSALWTMGYGAKFQLLSQLLPAQTVLGEELIEAPQGDSGEYYLEYLQDMVSKTNGFYARDYSIWLGWNNMRYIIETAVLHGRILNRTTIIPSFVYARACELDVQTCATYATMIDRTWTKRRDEWTDPQAEQPKAWKIPVTLMFNITHLQQSHAVITVDDYFRLHDISTDVETRNAQWDVDTYHARNSKGELTPSLHVVENDWYDADIVRIDRIPQDMRARGWWEEFGGDPSHDQAGRWSQLEPHSAIYHALIRDLPSNNVLDWDTARTVLENGEHITSTSSVEEVGDVLRENGFEVIYSFDTTWVLKTAISPVYAAVPRLRIRGLYDDLRGVKERVLLVRGEIHTTRPPGSLYFSSAESRARFTETVLHDMRLTDDILALAERISDRMFALNGGRLWMAAHMRRGDFAKLGWAMESDFQSHTARIKNHLQSGRELLEQIHGGQATTYDVPNVHADSALVTLEPPRVDDRFYIATDERDPNNLEYLREQGAVVISDLLTKEDHREIGWPILFTDVLALVEQSIMSRAAYFYAHSLSSVAGGVMNLRAGLGKDPRTALLD